MGFPKITFSFNRKASPPPSPSSAPPLPGNPDGWCGTVPSQPYAAPGFPVAAAPWAPRTSQRTARTVSWTSKAVQKCAAEMAAQGWSFVKSSKDGFTTTLVFEIPNQTMRVLSAWTADEQQAMQNLMGQQGWVYARSVSTQESFCKILEFTR